MSEYATINGVTYPEFGDAFNNNGTFNDGIYYVGPELAENPSTSLKTVLASKVAFPGTFDGIATVELGYDAHPSMITLALFGSLTTVAGYIGTLSTNLIRSDGARYTVSQPGSPDRPGCKLIGKPRCFPPLPFGADGKVLVQVLCYFEQLSDAN